jgi:uncharacterized protein YecT (DUF1311 family)
MKTYKCNDCGSAFKESELGSDLFCPSCDEAGVFRKVEQSKNKSADRRQEKSNEQNKILIISILSVISIVLVVLLYISTDDKIITQMELNISSGKEAEIANTELNKLYEEQMNYLTDEKRKKRLEEAQLAWIKYRDATCLYEAGEISESGSIWPMRQSVCIKILTKQRNKILKNYVSCRGDGCR